MDEIDDTGRLEAFSDGVFAIAITLLAFNVKIPKPEDLGPDQNLGRALLAQWPVYVAYLTSFLTILVMWINHHRLYRLIRRTNRPLMIINGLLLMFVTLVPYPTALVAEYLRRPQVGTAVTVYSGTFVMIALCYNGMWRYAKWDNHLLGREVNVDHVRMLHAQYRWGPVYYIVAFAISFFHPMITFWICMAMACYFALPALPARRQKVIQH
jgi:uncharacterized membrane protein